MARGALSGRPRQLRQDKCAHRLAVRVGTVFRMEAASLCLPLCLSLPVRFLFAGCAAKLGEYNDIRLRSMAEALLLAGASSVVAIREALADPNQFGTDPRVYFDAEVIDVAA